MLEYKVVLVRDMKNWLKATLLTLVLSFSVMGWGQSVNFFTDRAVGTYPIPGQTGVTALVPVQYGQVRVCNFSATPGIPCASLATITDINGNPLSVSGGNFGQLSTDVVGRFSFGCTPGTVLTIQVEAVSSNTPLLNYPTTCPFASSGSSIDAIFNSVTAGAGTLQSLNNLQMCDQSASTSACQTSASTTKGMLLPPSYSIGAFTNSNKVPVVDLTRVDWLGVISVREFGAKGDGSTDDTTAIQSAINYACTGTLSAPTFNTCTSWVSGTAVGGTVYLPAGDYHISAPLVLYEQVRLVGAGKLVSKITKINNAVGTIGSITAGTGVGRSPTACGGSPCVDNFNVDAIIEVPYISSGNTDYAYRWTIRDLALYGSGTNGTKYGIYAPRSAQSEMKNLYIFMNCSQGAPANCGSVQGSAFYTEDAWLMRHEGVTVDSSWIAWNHVNDGSNIGSGTSGIFSDDWGVNIGCSGYHFFGLSYSSLIANAIDNYNKKGTDLANTDLTCVPYAFTSVSGLSINGGGAENLTGGVMYAASSSIVISGGFKTFTQTGYTSAGTLATLFLDQASTVTMNGTSFSAVTSPGNIFNIVLQGGSTLIDNNSVLPTGGNTFISYAGGSTKIDTGNGGITLTNGSGTRTSTPTTDTFSPQKIANGTAAMTTAAIASGACGTTVTVAAVNVTTSDVIDFNTNASVTTPNGLLVPHAWPTSGNVNFNYCNPTAASQTPTAATVNWSVRR